MTIGVWDITRWDQSVWSAESVPYNPLLQDYTALVSAVVNLIRDDEVDADQARLFIAQAHSEIQHELLQDNRGGSPPIQMLARGTTTADDNSGVTLPEDFLNTRAVSVNGSPARYFSPEHVATGAPGYAEADVQLDYYVRLPQLSNANPTNWLLEIAPSAYLYRSALVYVPWAQRWEKEDGWTRFYDRSIAALKHANRPRPRGSFVSYKARPYMSGYTIIGDAMLFTGPQGNQQGANT